MSDYLPLRPLGQGSEIECFGSFWVRVANAHGLPINGLAKHLSQWWRRRGESSAVSIRENLIYCVTGVGLAGYGRNVSDYLTVLGKAIAYPHLQRTTLVSLSAVASPNAAYTFWASRHWCSACMFDSLKAGEPHYDRLLWTLRMSVRCVQHRILLHDLCPHCGERQNFFCRTRNLAQCYRCLGSLQHPVENWKPVLQPAFGEKGCVELVDAIADGSLDVVDTHAFETFDAELEGLLSPLRFRTAKIARRRRSHAKPTLYTMFKRAAACGLSVVDMLLDPRMAARVAGEFEFLQAELPTTAKPRRPPEAAAIVAGEMDRLIKSEKQTEIPSLKELARSLGVSEGFIRHHHPSLVQQYAKARMRFTAMRRTRSLKAMDFELNRELLAKYRSKRISSHDEIVQILIQRCNVGKYLARWALKRALLRKKPQRRRNP